MTTTPHPSTAHLHRAPTGAFLPALVREGWEWTDTDATFKPTVLDLYPDVKPFTPAAAYGVGYGMLVALNGAGKQIAAWSGGTWLFD